MKNKHTIDRILTIAAAIFLIIHTAATAADKVVVIPLESGSGDSGGIRPVMSAEQVWMDRNLGAHRAAIKRDDPQAYGSLYQWGRLGDGHEYRESPTTTTLSPGDVPGHGHFITMYTAPWDWMASPNDNLWQGASGINNPCPAGFRLPTETEWETERMSWDSNNAAGAFASPLKLVVAGVREFTGGLLLYVNDRGFYWSNTIHSTGIPLMLFSLGNNAFVDGGNRAYGSSVRCIKD